MMIRKVSIVLLIACWILPTTAFAQSSENYSLKNANLNAGGATAMTSSNYSVSTTLGQSSPVGISSGTSYQGLLGVQYAFLQLIFTVEKAGSGTGTIIIGDQECGLGCTEITTPFVKQGTVTIDIIPEEDSYFERWENAAGTPIEGIHYAKPGEKVFAVFGLKQPE